MFTRAPGWEGARDGTGSKGTGVSRKCAECVPIRAGRRDGVQRARANPHTSTRSPVTTAVEVEAPREVEDFEHDRPWIVIVWNDPINLMSYVTLVLQKLFGYSKAKATKLMLQVHNEGKAVVSTGTREKAEH